MRKLLVASQKSDVGKTTTSINLAAATAMAGARVLLVEADALSTVSTYLNLAEHPNRQSLKSFGIELPGVLCSEVLPGMDVICPYDEGGCSDEDLDQVLSMLAAKALQDGYDCLIVNAPPFMGGRPAPLLKACNDFLVVMQAESTAYRTMPAFLQMIQQAADAESIPIHMKGILITLPEGEGPGGRYERELRGRFGKRVLPQVVPFDEEVPRAQMFGHIPVHASTMSPSAQAFQDVVAHMELAEGAGREVSRSAKSALVTAATTAKVREAAASAAAPVAPPKPKRPSRAGRAAGRPGSQPPSRSKAKAKKPSRSVPPSRKAATPRPAGPAPAAPQPAVAPSHQRQPQAPAPVSSSSAWMIWVLVATVIGIGLRFVKLSPEAVPIIVGLAVSSATILVLKLVMTPAEEKVTPAPAQGRQR